MYEIIYPTIPLLDRVNPFDQFGSYCVPLVTVPKLLYLNCFLVSRVKEHLFEYYQT